MIIISFISQKGGVGKSTLTRALAREAAAGEMSVKVADLDTDQATVVDWHRLRLLVQPRWRNDRLHVSRPRRHCDDRRI